eukprot:1326694-Rhodomonas_salina.1
MSGSVKDLFSSSKGAREKICKKNTRAISAASAWELTSRARYLALRRVEIGRFRVERVEEEPAAGEERERRVGQGRTCARGGARGGGGARELGGREGGREARVLVCSVCIASCCSFTSRLCCVFLVFFFGCATQCPVLAYAMLLRLCYAVSGTDLGCAATRRWSSYR